VEIYQGDVTQWEQLGATPGKIYAVAREKGDSTFAVLNQHVPGFKDIETPKAKICFTTSETLETLAKYPGTIGFLPLSMVNQGVLRIIKIHGHEPTMDAFGQGKYPYVVPVAVVYRADELTGLRQSFVEYLLSPASRKCMVDRGTFPWMELKKTTYAHNDSD
jgi:ABC-type phosphate transport system substrate-binding protein